MSQPSINVTPLIDVLLVLLIIFMVVAPLKPAAFKARIPAEQQDRTDQEPSKDALVVIIDKDSSLSLNGERGLGTTEAVEPLVARLKRVFAARVDTGNISQSFGTDAQRPFSDRAERTVFIKAPRSVPYGTVARVVDAVKLAGAYPISLQIDRLE